MMHPVPDRHGARAPGGTTGHVPAATVAAIAAARDGIEQRFTVLGDGILKAEQHLKSIAATHLSMAAEFTSDDFDATVLRIRGMRQKVEAAVAHISGGNPSLLQLERMIRALRSPLSETEAAIRMLGMVAFNARVVVATIEHGGGDLVAFTDEMISIATTARDMIARVILVYEDVRRFVAVAHKRHSELSRDHQYNMTVIAADLDADLRLLQEQRSLAADHAARAARLAEEIADRVGSAFSAMQIGDMTRQRLDHIVQILETEKAVGTDRQGPTSRWILKVAAAQFAATQADRSAELAVLISSLEALRRDAGDVLHDGTEGAGETIGRSRDRLQALLRNLSTLAPILRNDAESRARDRKLDTDATAAMQTLLLELSPLASMEHQVRLLGLNMAIRSSKLGAQARGLRVVASEMSALANETRAAAHRVRQVVSDAQAAMGAASQPGTTDGMGTLADQPDTAAEGVVAMLARLDVKGAALRRACPEALGILHDTVRVARRLAADRLHDGNLAQHLARADRGVGCDGVDLRIMDKVRSVYTMQRERQVHDGLCGASSARESDTVRSERPATAPSRDGPVDAAADVAALLF